MSARKLSRLSHEPVQKRPVRAEPQLPGLPPCRVELRRRSEFGVTLAAGVTGRHHFCFAGHQHPDRISWGALHGINLYEMAPGAERPHSFHAGFEIVTIVLAGRWKRTGSLPAAVPLSANEAELVSTGIGTTMGGAASGGAETSLVELWISSRSPQSEPRRQWLARRRTDLTRPIALGTAAESDALAWDADSRLHYGWLERGERFRSRLGAAEHGYLLVLDGLVSFNNVTAQAGDGIAVSGLGRVGIEALSRSRLVWLRGL